MKKLLVLGSLALGLVGCGQSGTGGPAVGEVGVDTDQDYNRGEPAGAMGPTPAQTAEPIDPATSQSDATYNSIPPSVQPPNLIDTNPPPSGTQAPVPDNSAGAELNEQGTQTTPEPFTRDDQNPDAVNP